MNALQCVILTGSDTRHVTTDVKLLPIKLKEEVKYFFNYLISFARLKLCPGIILQPNSNQISVCPQEINFIIT